MLVLSIDLDWFNYVSNVVRVRYFFDFLKKNTKLPSEVHVIKEHHYLLPLLCKYLENMPNKYVEVINIDEHHDFYHLDSLNFNDTVIDCGNFFPFMVDMNMLQSYKWVGNKNTRSECRRKIVNEFNSAKDSNLRDFFDCISVYTQNDWYAVVADMKFDLVAIVKSPSFTHNKSFIYRTTYSALENIFPTIKKYQHSKNFKNKEVALSMKYLF